MRLPLPSGAAAWSRTYVDAQGLPQLSEHPVPVDANGRRTIHLRHTCRGKIKVGDGVQPCDHVAWLGPDAKAQYCPDHGCELTTEKPKAADHLLPQVWKAIEPGVRPVWLLAVEAAAGVALRAEHVPAWSVLAATPAVVAASYAAVRIQQAREKRRNMDKGEDNKRRSTLIAKRARTGAYIGTAAGLWLSTAAGLDPSVAAGRFTWTVALPVSFLVSAVPWWRHQAELRNRPAPPPDQTPAEQETPPVDADAEAAAAAARTWVDDVAVAGTHLDTATWKRISCGWQAVIVADKKGALNALGGDAMKATVKRIAAAFDVPKSAITWIEEHDDNPNRALLLVQPNNPLKQGQIWPGPTSIRITDARIEAEVGRLITGEPMLETLFRFGWGAPSEIGIGTTGGGKSMRVRKKLVIERWSSFVDPATGRRRGLFLSFLHDPKHLESYAEFRRAIHGYGVTRDDAHIMMDAFLREMFRRYDFLASQRWVDDKGRKRIGGVPWNPLVHGPILSCYWDEHHALTDDKELLAKEEKLARFQRACGMRAGLFSHMGTLSDTGSQALRDMLAGGRSTLFRTTSALNASLLTGGQLTADPRALPKDPGMCLVADGETATLMGRESWIPNDEDAKPLNERPLYDWLFDNDNEPIGFPAEIPSETAEAFGSEFLEWAAAGRRPEGRDGTRWASTPAAVRAESKDEQGRRAIDALVEILVDAGRPLIREEIVKAPAWAGRAVRTLSTALRAAQDAKPALVRKVDGSHSYEATDAARTRIRLARERADEEQLVSATEGGPL